MDKSRHPVWDASDKVLPKSAHPSAKPAAAPSDKLPVRLRWLILVALTALSWAVVGAITIVVAVVVRHLDW